MAHTLCTGASLPRYAAFLHPLPAYDSKRLDFSGNDLAEGPDLKPLAPSFASHALPHYGFSDNWDYSELRSVVKVSTEITG